MSTTGRTGTYYHFTSTAHLPWILRDGFLKTVESNVGSPLASMPPTGQHVGPDVVWLLGAPELQHDHGLGGNPHDKTQVRFTVRTRAARWSTWEPGLRMHPEWRRAMIMRGGGVGASKMWYVTPRVVHRAEWLALDVRQDGEWRPVSMVPPKSAAQ